MCCLSASVNWPLRFFSDGGSDNIPYLSLFERSLATSYFDTQKYSLIFLLVQLFGAKVKRDSFLLISTLIKGVGGVPTLA
jgi:hypothetical protein